MCKYTCFPSLFYFPFSMYCDQIEAKNEMLTVSNEIISEKQLRRIKDLLISFCYSTENT